MENKVLNTYLENVIESEDFARGFSKLKDNCINKGIEGSFGALIKYSGKNLWLNDFEIMPNLNIGDCTSVKDGLVSPDNSLITTYSKSKLSNPLEEVTKIAPYFDIHSHPNGVLAPSFLDLLGGFKRLNLTKGNPYFSMIVTKGEDNIFPLLLIKFSDFLGEKENIKPDLNKEYSSILERMKYDFRMKSGAPNKRLLNVLLNEPPKKFENISWEYFVYDLKKRRIK